MVEVGLDEIEEPGDGSLVVGVLLTFEDNLLAAVDELVATLGREVFLGEELLRTIGLLIGAILVLLRDATGDVIL